MIDLTQYSDDELSLHVFNGEGFYNIRDFPKELLLEALETSFMFTPEQLKVLETDLIEDQLEAIQ